MPEWRLRLLPLPPEDTPGNLTQLSGRLLERGALRRTPAGIPVLEFLLAHVSTQVEADVERVAVVGSFLRISDGTRSIVAVSSRAARPASTNSRPTSSSRHARISSPWLKICSHCSQSWSAVPSGRSGYSSPQRRHFPPGGASGKIDQRAFMRAAWLFAMSRNGVAPSRSARSPLTEFSG